MLLSEYIRIRWFGTYKQHYIDKGNKYTKSGDSFLVKVVDLHKGSSVEVLVLCDYCGKLIRQRFDKHNQNKDIVAKDCCFDCRTIKLHEVEYIKYGVINVSQLPEIQEKIILTNIKKYGVERPSQNSEILQKMKDTTQERYGVDNYSYTDEFKQKYKNTMLEHYGVEHGFQSEEIKNKLNNTKSINGTISCSKQQKYICDLLKGELNYPVDNCALDITFPEEKIYIEYDGSGHDLSVKFGNVTIEEFKEKTKRRWYYLNKLGWKEIKIISLKDKLPSDEMILEMIQYAKEYLNNGHSWIQFNIDNNKVINSQNVNKYNFGRLRYIK